MNADEIEKLKQILDRLKTYDEFSPGGIVVKDMLRAVIVMATAMLDENASKPIADLPPDFE